MAGHTSTFMRCLLVKFAVLAVCSAYPYLLDPDYELSDVIVSKRAFDRLEGNEFGLLKRALNKRAFDRLDMADFGLRRKRAFDRIARAEFGLTGLRRKRSSDLSTSNEEFGLRRRRALDRIGGSEFGLIKRSVDPHLSREELINDLADSIVSLHEDSALHGPKLVVFPVPAEERESNR
ncbi:hypothetical protein NECAME_13585 [Necator americanus]|uniref:Uncharacterized protein n=1 Tax=Necator americanus TaxID=51031 RepID=W2SWX8_NECAM|nr:hypothetical protein NECAME_13585 [Necator americanus]ETN73207.1 hypothetical protein NECAME_13585 [Necator americanus]